MENNQALKKFLCLAVLCASIHHACFGEISGDYTYTVTDEKIEITGLASGGTATSTTTYALDNQNAKTLRIPSQINGLPVTSIGDYAFANPNIKSITIPGSVTKIGVSAFLNCENLMTLYFLGDAPAQASVTLGAYSSTLIYCQAGASGWGGGYDGRPVVSVSPEYNGDNDEDGLSNFEEVFTFGSSPDLKDSNSDGVEDGQAVSMGYIPTLDLSPLINHPPAGLYSRSQIQGMAGGGLVLSNNTSLYYDIERSNDLRSWSTLQSDSIPLGNLLSSNSLVVVNALPQSIPSNTVTNAAALPNVLAPPLALSSQRALNRYKYKLQLAISSRWNMKSELASGQLGTERVVIQFHVNSDGSFTDLVFSEGSPNTLVGTISYDSIYQSSTLIGSFPLDLATNIPNGFNFELTFQVGVGVGRTDFVLSVECDSVQGFAVEINPDNQETIYSGPEQYYPGSIVALKAYSRAGYIFSRWSGDVNGASNPTTVAMDSNKNIQANFTVDNRDSDNDGLTNYQECIIYGSNPECKDSNSDGVEDGQAVLMGFSPRLDLQPLSSCPPNGLFSVKQIHFMYVNNFGLTKGSDGSLCFAGHIKKSSELQGETTIRSFSLPNIEQSSEKTFFRVRFKQ